CFDLQPFGSVPRESRDERQLHSANNTILGIDDHSKVLIGVVIDFLKCCFITRPVRTFTFLAKWIVLKQRDDAFDIGILRTSHDERAAPRVNLMPTHAKTVAFLRGQASSKIELIPHQTKSCVTPSMLTPLNCPS